MIVTIFRRRRKRRRAWCIYHSFWQIERRRATRGIGFSQKIDFSRVVVGLTLAGGRFTVADPISPTSFLRLFSIPTCYSAAFTASNGKLDLLGSLLLYSQLVRLTYDLSRRNCVGGATHSRLCVPLFLPAARCPLELYSVSVAYRSIREMHCIPYVYVYVRIES